MQLGHLLLSDFIPSACAQSSWKFWTHALYWDSEWNFPKHSTIVMLRADMQRKTLQEMLVAAKQAKDDYATVQSAAREEVFLSQSFVSSGHTGGASAFPSQAETTLTR